MKTIVLLGSMTLAAAAAMAQAGAPALKLTATSQNVKGAPDEIRITLTRWSTDAERAQALSAWNLENLPAPPAAGRGGRGGGGGGRGGRGGAPALPAAPPTPEVALATELEKMPTVGYLWSSETAGYALRYAVRLPATDGSARVLLIANQKLGQWSDLWDPTSGTAPAYEFSLIELRLNSSGTGEGKTSLTGKVAVDTAARALALENYTAQPVILKDVRGAK
jgi:hypothetical protein